MVDKTPHIVVVDDDRRVREMLCRYLNEEGMRTTAAPDGAGLRKALSAGDVDLVLLDLVMPGEDGLSLARELRNRTSVPFIILTGRGDVVDRVVGLELGADDYIAKPFHLREVLARIGVVLRRASGARQTVGGEAAPAEGPTSAMLDFNGWHLDLNRRELFTAEGETANLTSSEFVLLRTFAENPNRVLSRDQLMDMVHDRDRPAFDRAIDVQVGRLRRKIGDDGRSPRLIKTVRGGGYMFTAAVRKA